MSRHHITFKAVGSRKNIATGRWLDTFTGLFVNTPEMTNQECREWARRSGCIPVFVYNDKPLQEVLRECE